MHNDYNRIVDAMKGIVVNTLSDLDMSDILVGEVTGVDPLAITVDQKITIPESNILLTKKWRCRLRSASSWVCRTQKILGS